MAFEQLTPPKFVNPRHVHDPTDSNRESVEPVRFVEKGVRELGNIEPTLDSSANTRRSSVCSSLTDISEEPTTADEPTTAVECPVQFDQPTEFSSDSPIDGGDDPMDGVDAGAQLDSQEDGQDDPMVGLVGLELKAVSSDLQKGGEDVPMHGRELEERVSKERPSKRVTKESNQTSVDSELANKLAAFDLRRSSRNSAKEKPSQKVTIPPKLSNVKRKSVIKKDGILSLVRVWNILFLHTLTAIFQDDFEDGRRKLSDVELATVRTRLFRCVNASQHLKIVSPNPLCQHCRVGINCGGWPKIISTCARPDCATWKSCIGKLS